MNIFNNCYRGKRVLITGHTGFKGSWLAIWLKQLGADVYGYALPPLSAADNFVKCNVKSFIDHCEGHVCDAGRLTAFFNDVKPDMAFHLAAQPLVLLSYKEPAETFKTNLLGTINFFEAVRHTPSVKAAINVTSDKCYDNKEWVWGYRENDPMGGKDPYSASKGCSELITASYISSFFSEQGTTNIASARAGNVIGGGDWAIDRIVPDYFRAVLAKKPFEIRNPDATRPWQHVLEPLSGYLNLCATLYEKGKAFSGGWNFGPNDTANYSVIELIEKMKQVDNNADFILPELQSKHKEAVFLKLDISKATKLLNWHPILTFNETIQFTVKGYQDEFAKPNSVLASRIEQINNYVKQAKNKASWAGTF